MTAAIQAKDDANHLPDQLKREIDTESCDEAKHSLHENTKRMDQSHFGSLPRLESFQRNEIDGIM